MACLFGHKWNGCKCEKCGKIRNEGHQPENDNCLLCGAKLLRVDVFSPNELSLIASLMFDMRLIGSYSEKTSADHAIALYKLFSHARSTGKGWLAQEDIAFLSKSIFEHAAALLKAGKYEANEYRNLSTKLIKLDEHETVQDIFTQLHNESRSESV